MFLTSKILDIVKKYLNTTKLELEEELLIKNIFGFELEKQEELNKNTPLENHILFVLDTPEEDLSNIKNMLEEELLTDNVYLTLSEKFKSTDNVTKRDIIITLINVINKE